MFLHVAAPSWRPDTPRCFEWFSDPWRDLWFQPIGSLLLPHHFQPWTRPENHSQYPSAGSSATLCQSPACWEMSLPRSRVVNLWPHDGGLANCEKFNLLIYFFFLHLNNIMHLLPVNEKKKNLFSTCCPFVMSRLAVTPVPPLQGKELHLLFPSFLTSPKHV